MESIIIKGGKSLKGTVNISGSKNAALPILATSILVRKLELNNIPHLADISSMLSLLESLGINNNFINRNSVVLESTDKISSIANYNLVRKMRASFLVLGPLLTRTGNAKVSLPGGCAIGLRPVDLHIYAMKMLGAEIELIDGYVIAKAKKSRLIGNKIEFPEISVGATENAIMAAVLASGETLILNAAREPEVEDLCNCLISMGAKIDGVGTSEILIDGVNDLEEINYDIISDRIEVCTFIIAAAITQSCLCIQKVNSNHIGSFLNIMEEMGLRFKLKKNKLDVYESGKLKPISLKTSAYPGFPTDMQAQIVTLACLSTGNSEVQENIFENRFMHIPELNRLGANISIEGNKAIIKGNSSFVGAEVMATDLRASVSLILAGLACKGTTKVNRVYHLDRGYEKIDKKLIACGAEIYRKKNEKP